MTGLANTGHGARNGLRIERDSELMMYAAMNMTVAIFHLGGATTAFKIWYREPSL
jgi:hypothetical protein